MKEIYVLLYDDAGTTFSRLEPLKGAVTTEEEAKRFVEEGNYGYGQDYIKVVIFDDKDKAIEYDLDEMRKQYKGE